MISASKALVIKIPASKIKSLVLLSLRMLCIIPVILKRSESKPGNRKG
jgi:hypothetical protein